MKAALIAILFAGMPLIGAGAACAAEPIPDGSIHEHESVGSMVLFRDPNTGLEIEYPKNWSLDTAKNSAHIAKFKPPYPGISITVSQEELQNEMSLKKFTDTINDLAVKDGAQHNWQVKVLESKPGEEISHIPSFLSTLSYTLPPPVGPSIVSEATLIHGKKGYTIVFMSISAFHEAYLPVFEEMLKTVKIK